MPPCSPLGTSLASSVAIGISSSEVDSSHTWVGIRGHGTQKQSHSNRANGRGSIREQRSESILACLGDCQTAVSMSWQNWLALHEELNQQLGTLVAVHVSPFIHCKRTGLLQIPRFSCIPIRTHTPPRTTEHLSVEISARCVLVGSPHKQRLLAAFC